MPRPTSTTFIGIIILLIGACSSGGSGSRDQPTSPPPPETNPPPILGFSTPLAGQVVRVTSLGVTGTATGAGVVDIDALYVNGALATPSPQGYAVWSATVPINPDATSIALVATAKNEAADDIATTTLTLDVDLRETANLFGAWTGLAEVVAGQHLTGGGKTAEGYFAQLGDLVVGVLDVHHGVGAFADVFTYAVTGKLLGDTVAWTSSDRQCGAADPIGLCYPTELAVVEAFEGTAVLGEVPSPTLAFATPSALDGVGYSPNTTVELPFSTAELTRESLAIGEHEGIVGTWRGDAYIGHDVIYALPLPMIGRSTLVVGGTEANATMLGYRNGPTDDALIVYVPGQEDVVPPATFRYDPASRLVWFTQSWTIWDRYLYLGEIRGDRLQGVILADPLVGGRFVFGGLPAMPESIDVAEVIGVFDFTKEP